MAQYDSYKSSGIEWIGDIPSHWEFRKFNHICRIITDFVASGSFADLRENVQYLSEPDYAMLVRTTDLANPDINEGRVYISKESYTFLSNSNLFGGEVIWFFRNLVEAQVAEDHFPFEQVKRCSPKHYSLYSF